MDRTDRIAACGAGVVRLAFIALVLSLTVLNFLTSQVSPAESKGIPTPTYTVTEPTYAGQGKTLLSTRGITPNNLPAGAEWGWLTEVGGKPQKPTMLLIFFEGKFWAIPYVEGPTPPVPPVPPVPPIPPVPPPPPPITDLNVAIILPEPRSVRGLTPDQVAILTSTTLRKYLDEHCGKDDDGRTPAYKGLFRNGDLAQLSPRWRTVLERTANEKGVVLAAVNGNKWSVTPLPANVQATMDVLVKVSGVSSTSFTPWEFPTLREPPAEMWAKYNPPDRVAIVGGERRFLSAKPRDLTKRPRGGLEFAPTLAAAKIDLIPRSEWPARIGALKAANAGLMPLTYPIEPYNQGSTNFCWVNCVAQGWVAMAEQQHRPRVLVSAASVGGPITGYRNVGGWPGDAFEFMLKTGSVRTDLWPSNAIKSSYASDAKVKADYPLHRLTANLADLGASGKMFDEVATCVLLGAPVAVCYDWWGHAVLAVGLEQKGGTYYLILRNSWGEFEDHGFFLLPEGSGRNKGTPDDAQVILSVQQASSRSAGRLAAIAA